MWDAIPELVIRCLISPIIVAIELLTAVVRYQSEADVSTSQLGAQDSNQSVDRLYCLTDHYFEKTF